MKNIHLLPTEKPSRLHFDSELFVSPRIQLSKDINSIVHGRNIYITSDEEIKEGDWVLYGFNLETIYEGGKDWKFTESDIIKCISLSDKGVLLHKKGSTDKELCQKIILTTDADLIADGVQAIDDEFLQWFVKNPSCEFVEWSSEKIERSFDGENWKYKYGTVIPQEEPKQDYSRVHLAHCYQGEYEDGCKYGEDNCPAKPLESKQETLEEAAERLYPDTSTPGYIDQYSEIARKYFIEGAKWQAERMYSEEEVENILIEYVKTNPTKPYRVVSWFEQFKKK